MKEFFQSKEAKRFYWAILNSLMGLLVAFLTYLAADSVAWAAVILPIAIGFSQMLTKHLNT